MTTATRTTATTETRTTATTGAEAEATTSGASPSPSAGRRELATAGDFVGELFAEHGRMVLGLCRLLLRDPVEAEDATQQVFLSAHHAILRGAHPRDPPVWLAAIARNECYARIRERMREPLELPELPSDLPDPLAAAIRAVDLEAFWTALSALPRRQRRALVLRELGGLSYHELGRALGVSQSAVQSLLFRARQHVRSVLASANAATVPLAVREGFARLIPDFDPGSAGLGARIAALPAAVKLATAAAVGVGVVATGAGQSGEHRARSARPHSAPTRPAAVQPDVQEQGRSELTAAPITQRPSRSRVTPARLPTRALAERNRDQSDPVEAEHKRSSGGPGPGAEVKKPEREPAEADTESDSSGPGPGAQPSSEGPDQSGSGSDHSGPSGGDPKPGDD